MVVPKYETTHRQHFIIIYPNADRHMGRDTPDRLDVENGPNNAEEAPTRSPETVSGRFSSVWDANNASLTGSFELPVIIFVKLLALEFDIPSTQWQVQLIL